MKTNADTKKLREEKIMDIRQTISKVPYVNSIFLEGIVQDINLNKTVDGTIYTEIKLFTQVDIQDFNNILWTDKKHFLFNISFPLYFYPFNVHTENIINNVIPQIKKGDFISVRGYLESLFVHKIRFDNLSTSVGLVSETVVQGIDLFKYKWHVNTDNINQMTSIGRRLNYGLFSGFIIEKEKGITPKNRDALHLVIGIPKVTQRRIGVKYNDGVSNDIDIIHLVSFKDKVVRFVDSNFNKGDVVIATGQLISKFFSKEANAEIFKDLKNYFLVNFFSLSKVGSTELLSEFDKIRNV